MWTYMPYMVIYYFFIVLIVVMFTVVRKKSRLSPSRKKSATIYYRYKELVSPDGFDARQYPSFDGF